MRSLNPNLRPILILGGDHGALSIARSLGAAGIQVYAINYPRRKLGTPVSVNGLIYPKVQGVCQRRGVRTSWGGNPLTFEVP